MVALFLLFFVLQVHKQVKALSKPFKRALPDILFTY